MPTCQAAALMDVIKRNWGLNRVRPEHPPEGRISGREASLPCRFPSHSAQCRQRAKRRRPSRPASIRSPFPRNRNSRQPLDAPCEFGLLARTAKPCLERRCIALVWTKQPFKANRDYVCDSQGQATVELPQTLDILRLWTHVDGYVPLWVHWEKDWQDAGNPIPEEFTFRASERNGHRRLRERRGGKTDPRRQG